MLSIKLHGALKRKWSRSKFINNVSDIIFQTFMIKPVVIFRIIKINDASVRYETEYFC